MTQVINDNSDKRIPVNIITGFLGSGKTTLLNNWVNSDTFKDTLVLINEFGDVGLDHELVQAVDDTVVLLGSGCICCQLQGELVDSLVQNLTKSRNGTIPKLDRVLIETTGLADPSGVISTLNADEFIMDNFCYDGTVTVLDGQFVREQLKTQYEAVKQIALADLILISKTDLIDQDEIDAIFEVTQKINDSCKIYPIVKGNIDPHIIDDIGPYRNNPSVTTEKVSSWLNIKKIDGVATSFRPVKVEESIGLAKPKIIAHTNIDSFCIVHKDPIDALALLSAISIVQQQYGDSILRIKGIINITNQQKPVVIHGVQGNLYPLTELDNWPDDDHTSKLVFIVRQTVLEQIKHIFEQALNNPDESTIGYYRQMLQEAGIE